MKTGQKNKLTFADLPRDYAALCSHFLPRPIRDKNDYRNTLEMAEVFAGRETDLSPDQGDYFELLGSLLEDWEATHVKWKKLPPVGILKHLLNEHDMSGADLSRLLNVSPKLGPMILRGERAITADHARTLGAYFGLPAGTFID